MSIGCLFVSLIIIGALTVVGAAIAGIYLLINMLIT